MKIKQIIVNLLDKAKTLGKRRLMFLASMILLLVVAVPLTLIQVQQQQQIRQRANATNFAIASNVYIDTLSLQSVLILENRTEKDITGVDILISFPIEFEQLKLITFEPNPEYKDMIVANEISNGNINFVMINPAETPLKSDLSLGTLTIDISGLNNDNIMKLTQINIPVVQITTHSDTDTIDFISATPIKEEDLASLLSQIAPDTTPTPTLTPTPTPTSLPARSYTNCEIRYFIAMGESGTCLGQNGMGDTGCVLNNSYSTTSCSATNSTPPYWTISCSPCTP